MMAEPPVTLVEVTLDRVGAVVSRTIASVNDPDQLPMASLNWTNTVLVPAPIVSVQVFVVAYASSTEKLVPVLENRMLVTGPGLSVAASVSVDVLLLVAAAPPLIAMVPVGG